MVKLRACAKKLKLLAEEDPQVNLMAISRPRWETISPSAEMIRQMYTAPDLSKVRFGTRLLVEGLIGLGTLKPGDVVVLLVALRIHAMVPAMQERILESLFGEERIRDVKRIVAGELKEASYPALLKLTNIGKARYLRHVPPPQLAHLVMIRSVLITPTRVLIGPPQQEPSNSVTRKYADKLDGIVRVSFADEEDRLFVSCLPSQLPSSSLTLLRRAT